ncbi:MAG: CRISPR-associated endonuclease Cas2 [Candidatus Helarchaeota archaeon]
MVRGLLYLVTYDIPQEENAVRSRVAMILKNYGLDRLQYSVFIGYLTPNQAETVSMRLADVTAGIEADVRMFPICDRCFRKLITVKSKKSLEQEEVVIL